MKVPVWIIATVPILMSPVPVFAQDSKATATETVASANAEPRGADYVLSLKLDDGRQLNFQVPQTEALKIVRGLSKPAGPDSEKRQMVTLVHSMGIQADRLGRFVVLQPIGAAGPLGALAIPLGGADRFIQQFQNKAEETKANVTQQQK
jgi:hypothetical protein